MDAPAVYERERLFGELEIGEIFQTEGGVLMQKTEANRAQVVDKPLFRFFNSATLVFALGKDHGDYGI